MNKEFIPYQEALELKELGFDEPCLIKDTEQGEDCAIYYVHSNGRPTFSQAFRWFREKYQIDSWIYPNLNGLYSVSNVRRGVGLGKVSEYQTYEEAELECLKKLIQIVKNKGGDK